jgi:hypothetical protein
VLVSGPFGPLAQGSLLARRAPRPVTAPVFGDEPRTPWLDYTNEQLRSGCVVLLDVSGTLAQPLSVLPPGKFDVLGQLPPERERVAVAEVPLAELRASVGDRGLVRLLTVARVTLVVWYVDIRDFTTLAPMLPRYRTVVLGDNAVATPDDPPPPAPALRRDPRNGHPEEPRRILNAVPPAPPSTGRCFYPVIPFMG